MTCDEPFLLSCRQLLINTELCIKLRKMTYSSCHELGSDKHPVSLRNSTLGVLEYRFGALTSQSCVFSNCLRVLNPFNNHCLLSLF